MKRPLPLVFMFAFTCFHTLGQVGGPWIEEISADALTLHAQQKTILETLQQHPRIMAVYPVRLGAVRSYQQNGILQFQIPGDTKIYTVRTTQNRYQDDSQYEWRGESDYGQDWVRVHVMAQEGQLYGNIRVNDRFFMVRDLGQHQNVLVELPNTHITCGTTDAGADAPPSGVDNPHEIQQWRAEGTEGTNATVRVLIMYTPAALAYTDPHQLANLYMSDLNQIVSNSNLGGTISFVKAAVRHWPIEERPGNIDGDRVKLRDSEFVADIRESAQADVVVALTQAEYNDGGWPIGGISTLEVSNSEEAHAIVRVDLPADNYTFSHEVVHMFNCRHDIASDPNGPTAAHGYLFSTGTFFKKHWRTIMGIASDPRIPYLSNPAVEYLGTPTGTYTVANNAAQVAQEASTVCEYRPYVPPPSFAIWGPSTGENGTSYSWCLNTSNCDNPEYYWEYSTNGYSYTYGGTNRCITRTMPYNGDLYLRARVQCDGYKGSFTYHRVTNTSVPPCEMCRESDPLQNIAEAITLYPNPSTGSFSLSWGEVVSGVRSVRILDVQGRIVHEQNIQENHVEMSLELIPGIYRVQIAYTGGLFSKTLIMQ